MAMSINLFPGAATMPPNDTLQEAIPHRIDRTTGAIETRRETVSASRSASPALQKKTRGQP